LTIAVILVLAVMWIAVLTPPVLRARNQQHRADSVGEFRYRLGLLGHTNSLRRHHGARAAARASAREVTHGPVRGPVGVAGAGVSMTDAQRRRRDVLLGLVGVAGLTFLIALATRSMAFIGLQLFVDAALAGYVYLLLQYKQRGTGQRAPSVRFLSEAYRPEPVGYYDSYSDVGVAASRLVPAGQRAAR
jgi:hypothetical protein